MDDTGYRVVAAFVARLAERGVTDVVVSPGSRSTPLVLCFDAHPQMCTHIQLDERCAGFFALGLGRARGSPAVLVCTSGTAAANYLPAVVEACHAGVPLIVCTADRPPELRGFGSPQTIDQVDLYGPAVRWSSDVAVPDTVDEAEAVGWADTAFDRAVGVDTAFDRAVGVDTAFDRAVGVDTAFDRAVGVDTAFDRAVGVDTAFDRAVGVDTAFDRAVGADPGPVHLNWPLREPLEPLADLAVGAQPPASHADQSPQAAAPGGGGGGIAKPHADQSPRTAAPGTSVVSGSAGSVAASAAGANRVPTRFDPPAATSRHTPPELAEFAEVVAGHARGVVVVGPWPGGGLCQERSWALEAARLAAWAGWPLIGEPITHIRGDAVAGTQACVVATADHLLADELLGDVLAPDVAVLLGRTFTTKLVRQWLERTQPRHVVLIDPDDHADRAIFRLTGHVPAPVAALAEITSTEAPVRDGGWLETWHELDACARKAVDDILDAGSELLSAQTARSLVSTLPDGGVLVASSSMPVRDLDAYVFRTGSLACCANRGVAGIDGTTSTALGIAAADPSRVVALYSGDLALLHDIGGLLAAARCGLHLIAVCVDNNGGEIFALLPVFHRVRRQDFERLFRTPHGVDLAGLDGFAGIRARRISAAGSLRQAVTEAATKRAPGVDLLVVEVSRDHDVAQRHLLTRAAQLSAERVLAAS